VVPVTNVKAETRNVAPVCPAADSHRVPPLRISIVTVSHNSAATILDTLRSVRQQSHASIEHIIVDGGSTDGTLAVVQREGSHVARVLSEPDRGIYDAMNKGLRLATGDFVGFLNSDDVLADPDAAARLADTVQRTGADAVFGSLVYVRPDDLGAVVRYWQCGEFSRQNLRLGWMPPHPTFYVRRSCLAEIGEFDTTLRIAADYDFMLRTLGRPGIAAARVRGLMVRMRTGGISNRSLKMLWRKSSEDLQALRRSGIGGWPTLLCKNLRKLPQFVLRTPTSDQTQRTSVE
jgi:glycosyltransferase